MNFEKQRYEVKDESNATCSKTFHSNVDLTSMDIYLFYKEYLLPSIVASFPILIERLFLDFRSNANILCYKCFMFLFPWYFEESSPCWKNISLAEYLLTQFDSDGDGQISASEMTMHTKESLFEIIEMKFENVSWSWLQAWPMIDWKIGVFLWRTCGGILILITLASIIPGRVHFIAGRIFRWPILGLTYIIIGVELIVYILIRIFIRLIEEIIANPKHRMLRRKMSKAKSYKEWYEIAELLDKSQGRDVWQRSTDDEISNRKYNWPLIKELVSDLRLARKLKDHLMALAVLQQCTRKNVGGIMNYELFSYTNTGEPKDIVIEFLDEVVETLIWITLQAKHIPSQHNCNRHNKESNKSSNGNNKDNYEDNLIRKVEKERSKIYRNLISHTPPFLSSSTDNLFREEGISNEISRIEPTKLPSLHREKVKIFLKRARAAYGRTALCLSGGAMMGNYHFGVVKALLDQDLLPNIISGTSAGSVVGGLICTRSKEELLNDLKPEILTPKLKCFSRSWKDRFISFYENGHIFSNNEWLQLIKWFTCGDLTFEEAFKKTGRIFCITLSATTKSAPPVLLNYISAPHVVIASAIVASAAVPGFINPVLLQIKDSNGVVRNQQANKDQLYWDGSIEQDIPTLGLGEMLNCQFFLASQCNPHIVPFFYNSKGDVGKPCRWSRPGHSSWRGGFLLSALELYIKLDMKAKFHFLNDLEAAVSFTGSLFTQVYEGTTTIVPKVILKDFFKLFSDPLLQDMNRYIQGGSVAAYQHCAMLKQHYRVSRAINECLNQLEKQDYRNCCENFKTL